MQLISALFPQPSRRRLLAASFALTLAAALVGTASFASASKNHEDDGDSDLGHGQHFQPHRDDQRLKHDNHGSGKLSEFRGTVDTVGGGKHPTDVAIAPAENPVVVANRDGRSLSLVDLGTTRVAKTIPATPSVLARIPVGATPSRVAIDTTRDSALVTNQDDKNVSVIHLTTRKEILPRLRVGEEQFGVAIEEDRGIAVVVNRLDGTLNVINLKPSTPSVLSLTVNIPILPTEVTIVPGIPNALRVVTTGAESDNVGAVEISSSVLP